MVKIFISRKAMKDLNTIKSYIAQDNPTRAESFCEELLSQTIETISEFPLSCPIYNKPNNIRRFVFGSYNIYYRISNNDRADILHILNSALLKNMTLKSL